MALQTVSISIVEADAGRAVGIEKPVRLAGRASGYQRELVLARFAAVVDVIVRKALFTVCGWIVEINTGGATVGEIGVWMAL